MTGHWRKEAACKGQPTQLFFPELHQANAVAHAKDICSACPVRQECKDDRPDSVFGVWGGVFYFDGDEVTDEEVARYQERHRERARRYYHRKKEGDKQ